MKGRDWGSKKPLIMECIPLQSKVRAACVRTKSLDYPVCNATPLDVINSLVSVVILGFDKEFVLNLMKWQNQQMVALCCLMVSGREYWVLTKCFVMKLHKMTKPANGCSGRMATLSHAPYLARGIMDGTMVVKMVDNQCDIHDDDE